MNIISCQLSSAQSLNGLKLVSSTILFFSWQTHKGCEDRKHIKWCQYRVIKCFIDPQSGNADGHFSSGRTSCPRCWRQPVWRTVDVCHLSGGWFWGGWSSGGLCWCAVDSVFGTEAAGNAEPALLCVWLIRPVLLLAATGHSHHFPLTQL